MAYQHADYMTESDRRERLRRLRLHMAEIQQQITPTVGAGGKSRDANVLESTMARLRAEERELELELGEGGHPAPVVQAAVLR